MVSRPQVSISLTRNIASDQVRRATASRTRCCISSPSMAKRDAPTMTLEILMLRVASIAAARSIILIATVSLPIRLLHISMKFSTKMRPVPASPRSSSNARNTCRETSGRSWEGAVMVTTGLSHCIRNSTSHGAVEWSWSNPAAATSGAIPAEAQVCGKIVLNLRGS